MANAKWIALGLGVLALLVAVAMYISSLRKESREAGKQTERAEAAAEVINRVEEANEVDKEIVASGSAGDNLRFNQCVRSARNPENCKRFLPQ